MRTHFLECPPLECPPTAGRPAYHPITAKPYATAELSPCAALAPYIRCFWGTEEEEPASVVIPDTCMDLIFHFGEGAAVADSAFCVIDENPYVIRRTERPGYSTFGIRFYGWAAVLFAGDKFDGSTNRAFPVEAFFPGLERELLPALARAVTLEQRAKLADGYLLSCLNRDRLNHNFMNAVCDMIDTRGTLKISELSAKNAVSKRQLERIFNENMGISPKNFSALVRYQMLWHDLCFEKRADVLDLVLKYEYYDQAHLLNDFRKHHGMPPGQAVKLARG